MTRQRSLSSLRGNQQRLDGGAMFGNAPKALWSRWVETDAENRIALACRALLIQEADRVILLEAGIGSFFSPKMKERFGVVEDEHVLLQSLAVLGLGPQDIDIIVLSHLHFDHAGGLLTSYVEGEQPALAFPRAQVLVGTGAWQRAQHPHMRDRASFLPELNRLLADSGRLHLVDGETHPLLGAGYRFHFSDGHTPGMLLTEIDMPAGPIVFAADLIPGTAWVHAPMSMGYDRYPEKLIDEKSSLLRSLVARGGRLFYTHDAACAMSSLEQDEAGRYRPKDEVAQVEGLTL